MVSPVGSARSKINARQIERENKWLVGPIVRCIASSTRVSQIRNL